MVPGKVPLYLEGEMPQTRRARAAANVGVEIAGGRRDGCCTCRAPPR